MELSKDEPLPHGTKIDVLLGGNGDGLAYLQRALRRPECCLERTVRRVSAPVIFQIEFPLVARQLIAYFGQSTKKRFGLVPLHRWHAGQRAQATGTLAHFLGRAASTVAITYRVQEFTVNVGLGVPAGIGIEFFRIDAVVVADILGDMSHDFAAVVASPDKT